MSIRAGTKKNKLPQRAPEIEDPYSTRDYSDSGKPKSAKRSERRIRPAKTERNADPRLKPTENTERRIRPTERTVTNSSPTMAGIESKMGADVKGLAETEKQKCALREDYETETKGMMYSVRDLIVCGYPTELQNQRDFVKEGEDFLASLSTTSIFL